MKKFNGQSNIFGKNLKKYRKLRGYSQRELSDKLALLGVDLYHSDISAIENHKLLLISYLKILITYLNNFFS